MRKYLTVKVIPKSPTPGVAGWQHGILKVKVSSPPVRGRANEELIHLLAEYLGVRREKINILSGGGSRLKRLVIEE